MSGDVLLRQAARVAWAIFSGNRGKATSIDLPPLRGVREGEALRGHLPNYVGEEGFRDVQDGFSHPRQLIGAQLEQPLGARPDRCRRLGLRSRTQDPWA